MYSPKNNNYDLLMTINAKSLSPTKSPVDPKIRIQSESERGWIIQQKEKM